MDYSNKSIEGNKYENTILGILISHSNIFSIAHINGLNEKFEYKKLNVHIYKNSGYKKDNIGKVTNISLKNLRLEDFVGKSLDILKTDTNRFILGEFIFKDELSENFFNKNFKTTDSIEYKNGVYTLFNKRNEIRNLPIDYVFSEETSIAGQIDGLLICNERSDLYTIFGAQKDIVPLMVKGTSNFNVGDYIIIGTKNNKDEFQAFRQADDHLNVIPKLLGNSGQIHYLFFFRGEGNHIDYRVLLERFARTNINIHIVYVNTNMLLGIDLSETIDLFYVIRKLNTVEKTLSSISELIRDLGWNPSSDNDNLLK
jgi:hypothetical protein